MIHDPNRTFTWTLFAAMFTCALIGTVIAAGKAHAAGVDLDKLARAVAVAETSNCTTGMGLTKNNCHGIMRWTNGKRSGRVFATTSESFTYFKSMWLRLYGDRFPTWDDAKRYTGNPHPSDWYGTVKLIYNR